MSQSNAWLLDCGDALTVAVADHEIVECIQPERYYPVPGTPDYCCSVLAWHEQLVPVIDLSAAIQDRKLLHNTSFVCLLSYQLAPKQPLQYVALQINKTPEKIQVDDDQLCEVPGGVGSELLESVALSCFSHQDLPIAILDVAGLCSSEFRELALAS